jgi:hypothetical protein
MVYEFCGGFRGIFCFWTQFPPPAPSERGIWEKQVYWASFATEVLVRVALRMKVFEWIVFWYRKKILRRSSYISLWREIKREVLIDYKNILEIVVAQMFLIPGLSHH